MNGPKLSTVAHVGTMANQRAYAVNVTYPGEDPCRVVFIGTASEYGPVYMATGENEPIRVDSPDRFGPFGPEWVRRFFA